MLAVLFNKEVNQQVLSWEGTKLKPGNFANENIRVLGKTSINRGMDIKYPVVLVSEPSKI